MKKSILVFLTASMLVFSLFTAGCSGTASDSSSAASGASASDGTDSETVSGSSLHTARTSPGDTQVSGESVISASSEDVFVPESVTTDSSVSTSGDIPGKATDLSIILEEIRITVLPGTAGSSLGCARAASDLLNFTNSTSMTADEIRSGTENYRAALSEDDRSELTEQFAMLRETVSSFQSETEDTIRDELSDAGVEDSDCPWTPAAYEKAEALLGA